MLRSVLSGNLERQGHGMTRTRWIAAFTVIISVLFCRAPAQAQGGDGFVGAQACVSCHAAQAAQWTASHHVRAMLDATPANVLGDFTAAPFVKDGVPTTFSRAGARFSVRTEGPDGQPHDYDLAYTFGIDPLQQYLIRLPGGRLQAFGLAWDTRPKDQGGQRWLDLYPGQRLHAADRLHWTGRDQTWNYQCAACHSTNLHKGFDLATNTYATTYTDVDVACEACHGPGARHVAWARTHRASDTPPGDRMGLANWLRPTDSGHWEMNPQTGIARRTAPLASTELDTCALCHARRKLLVPAPVAGAPLLDNAQPSLLETGLYFADGQIDGEVFEYGSFIQSAMHRAGVTCSDCHEPHGLKLRAEGNAVCAQCHMPARFDTASHHHHDPAGAGGRCIACHMPTRTYMIVHARHDHGLRVPRPDIAAAVGAPDACTRCHAERTAAWAAKAIAGWYPAGRQTRPHFATTLQAGRTAAADAGRLLDALIRDAREPPIARATALALSRDQAEPIAPATLRQAAMDDSVLVRAAAPRALPAMPSATLLQAIAPLLDDRIRGVRVEAARALAGLGPQLALPQRASLASATQELLAAELTDADRPEAHLNIGLLQVREGQAAAAEDAYRTALRLDPRFVPALVNWADLDRMRGQDAAAEDKLRQAVAAEPDNADAWHALGLTLVRRRAMPDAMAALRRAYELAPENARYAYVYAVGLNGTGDPAQALAVLEQAQRRHPGDRELLTAAIAIARDSGDRPAALRYARALAAVDPQDRALRQLIEQWESGRGP
jgi:predicted CXXCH cytochrome family protein